MNKLIYILVFLVIISCSPDSQETEIEVYTTDFTAIIDENPEANALIGKVSGTTNKGNITFEIIDQSPENSFSINNSTGELRVIDVANFDYETNPTISGQVKLTNGDATALCSIQISVKDVDETEVFTSDFAVSIDENPTYNLILGKVPGTTNAGEVKFELINQIPENSLVINESTGELEILNTVNYDFEANPQITAQVNVINGAVSETSNITITLNDVYEEYNIFNGSIQLKTQQEVDEFGAKNYGVIAGSIGIVNEYEKNIYSLEALSSLRKVKNIYISGLSLLKDLKGLEQLSEVTESFYVTSCGITNIKSLSNLTNPKGQIVIENNDALINLEGLENIKSIGSTLKISGNDFLQNITALSNLTSVGHDFNIFGNDALVSLQGLENLESVGLSFAVSDNNSIENLTGLNNLKVVKGYNFLIENNSKLKSLEGLNSLTTLGSDDPGYYITIKINKNPALENIDGLSKLTNFSGAFQTDAPLIFISDNESLLNIDGLTGITKALQIYVSDNNNLKNIDGLSNLAIMRSKYNGGRVEISHNNALTDFCGLSLLLNDESYDSAHLLKIFQNAYNPDVADLLNGNCAK